MAGRCSPKSKIHIQFSSRSGQTTNSQSQSLADKNGNLSYGGRLCDNESTQSVKRDIVDKGRFIRPIKFIDDDDDRSEDTDQVSLSRQQQFSSRSEASLDSELWNSQQEKQDDGSLMSKSSFPSVRTFDRAVLPQFTTMPEQRQLQKRQNNNNSCATEKRFGTEDKEKCKSAVSSKYESAFEDPKSAVRTTLTVYPEEAAGKGTSVKRSPAKVHISSELRRMESAATMKTLMNEFSDLTKKMSNLKQTLKSREPSPRSFKLKHSEPSSTNEISVITDVYGAKKIILDCIAELSIIKSFLDGNRRQTVDRRAESRENDVEDHRDEVHSHFSEQLERKSVVSTLTSGLPCLEDTVSKMKSDTMTVARTSSTRESLGFIKATSGQRSKLNLLTNTSLNSLDNTKVNAQYETSTRRKNISVSSISNILETQDCAVIRSSVPSEVETTERNRVVKKIDERIVDEDSKVNAEHKKSKKRKWYWCFMNCTRSASPRRKDNQFDRNDPTLSCSEDKGLQRDSASSKQADSVLPYDKEESKGLRSNVKHSELSAASHVDDPLFLTNNLKDLSMNSFRERIFDNQLLRINNCRSLSKLMDYGQFSFYYNKHGLDESNCKMFDKYNACREDTNRDVKDFVKSYAGWTSQPDFNTFFRLPARTNGLFFPVRCTNWNFAREPTRRTKSVDFLHFDESNSIFTASNTKKMEVDLEEQRIEATKDVDKSYTAKENVLKDVHQCLQNYLKHQRCRRSKHLKRISRSKSIKRLGVNSSVNSGTSDEICCALQIICRRKKECGYRSTRSKLSRKKNDNDEDRRNECCRKIVQTDERDRTRMKSKLQDQQEYIGERISVREKRNSDEIMTRRQEQLQMRKIEPSTNAYLQNYSNFYVVESIDASALKKSLFSEGQSHVLSSEAKASAKLSLNDDDTWNSKTFLCSGHSNAPRAPPYYIKRDSEDDLMKDDSLVKKDRLPIEGISVHRRKCDDRAKQEMRVYKECKLKNNRDSCIEPRTERCDFKDELFDKIDRSKMVWALAKVNAFDDGSRSYEIIKTTPLPPGQKVNVSRANVIKVGKTNYCRSIR